MNYKPYLKKIISIFIIVLIFCISIKYFINYFTSKNLHVTVLITAQVKQDDTFQLYYTRPNSSSFNDINSIKKEVKHENGFQTIKFDLPDTNIKSIELDTGTKPGELIIQNIKLKNIIHTYEFNTESIIDKFNLVNDIKKPEVKDGLVYIISTGNNPYIANADITYVLQQLNSKKIDVAKKVLAVVLCLMFSFIVALVLKLIYTIIINYRRLIEKWHKVLQNFLKYKGLLSLLVIRDIKIKYKRSFLGILWSMLNPFLTMLVMTIIFAHLFRFDIKNYPIYLLTGQIAFNFFSESTNIAMTSIIGSGSLIKKVYIPKYIFPASKVLSSFVNTLFSLVAIFVMMIITKQNVSWSLLLLPLPLIYLLIFSMGVGLILSAYAVYFRDLVHLYGVLLTAQTYFTPIFYPISIIPEKYLFLMKYNPMYYFVECFRSILYYAKFPTLQLNIICICISLVIFSLGMYVFYKKQNNFILYI